MKPTKTTNRIHFEDLSPDRFEDLCLSMIYRMNRWNKIQHYGRTGKDDGIDIYCEELLENGSIRKWIIQCKRYKSIDRKNLKIIVEDAAKKAVPDYLLLIISCDVSKAMNEYFVDEANKSGIKNVVIWSSSIIEAELYEKHHDLLFAFFDINLSNKTTTRISTIRRNISLKKKMYNDLTQRIDTTKKKWHCYDKFKHSNLLIRSIDDTKYPENVPNSFGHYPWYKVEPYDFYYNGLEVITSIRSVKINTEGKWHLKSYEEEDDENYVTRKVIVLGRIPYELIVDYDVDGDEYYNYPHLFCDFRNNGLPYEEYSYRLIDEENNSHYDYPLDNSNMEKEE